MKRLYSLAEANAILPLLRSIAAELVERRDSRRRWQRCRAQLEAARTPEGLRDELAEMDARIYEQDEGLHRARLELSELGMKVLEELPLTVHLQGHSRSGPVVFCWQEGETAVCYGHPLGEEEDQRRPLRLKAV
jgi:hypothetical protein